MTSLYDTYASQTGASALDHRADISRVAEHYRRFLLPALRGRVDLGHCRIFEFGAGWGRNLLALTSLGANDVCGIDISPDQVALGRGLGLASLELVAAGADPLQLLGGRQFDMVLAIDVLEHLDLDTLHAFTQMVGQILVPGGLLVVQVPNALAPFNPVISGDLTHLRCFTASSIRQLFELANAQPLYLAGVPFPGSGPIARVRSALAQWLVKPFVGFVSVVLYGRSSDRVVVEPNLLAIARVREGAKA